MENFVSIKSWFYKKEQSLCNAVLENDNKCIVLDETEKAYKIIVGTKFSWVPKSATQPHAEWKVEREAQKKANEPKVYRNIKTGKKITVLGKQGNKLLTDRLSHVWAINYELVEEKE